MLSFTEYLIESNANKYYHVTTQIIKDDIIKNGFNPKLLIDHKYYSSLGKDGIYFYDNLRWSQIYAYYLVNKLKIDKVSLITCIIPESIIQNNDKLEDGFYVNTKYLKNIQILDSIMIKPIDIY